MSLGVSERFEQINSEAAGQAAPSIAVFQDRLYLASVCDSSDESQSSVKILVYGADLACWVEVYQSLEFAPVNLGLLVFQAAGDLAPTLYTILSSAAGSKILRSEDGQTFRWLGEAAADPGNPPSLRQLLAVQDRLYAHSGSLIYVSDSPGSQSWQAANLPGFSDPANTSVSGLVAFNHQLYAATVNAERGFQVWKTQTTAPLPHHWQPVLVQGAYRYSLNRQIGAMAVFKQHLYVASQVPEPRKIPTLLDDTASELIRIDSDDHWQLIVGVPRFSPQGLKVPLAVLSSGFDDPQTWGFQCLKVHRGRLYAGVQKQTEFELWVTEEGELWTQVPLNRSNDGLNGRLCAAASTPLGLLLAFGQSPTTPHLEIWLGES